MKRIVSVLILLCTIVSAYADGDVIEIWTAKDLKDLRDNVNNGTNTYAGKTVKLMADLDLGSGWVPIGIVDDVSETFQGTFDGQGYTIEFDAAAPSSVLGLFGYLHSDGIVQQLKVKGTVFNSKTTETSSTAGIVAYNRGTINQCANYASIAGTTAGGIAGENHGTITNCYNQGYIGATGNFSGNRFLGGIAGAIDDEKATISNVYASCSIENSYPGLTGSITNGGIVANPKSGTMSNCFYNVLLDNTTPKTGSQTLTGDALKSSFNNSIWTFTEGELPELTCFVNKIVRLSDNNDNSAILTSYNGQKRTVELSGRTLYKDGAWNTLCLPFDLTLNGSVLEGDGVVAKVLDGTNTSLNAAGLLSLTFTSVSVDSEIEAGTPFIIKWDSGTDLTNVQFSGVTIKNTDPTKKAVTFSNAFGDPGQFVGTYSPFSINDGNKDKIVLLSGNNTLGYSQSTRTLRSCRAHFMIPTTSSGIRAMMDFDIDFDDEEVTAIANLKPQISSLKPESWFTLQGVKLDSKPTQRGIYLHNGRKEAIR